MNTKLAVFTGSDLRSYGGGEKDIIAWTNLIGFQRISIFSPNDPTKVRLSHEQIRLLISDSIDIIYYDAIELSSISDLIPFSVKSVGKILSCRNYDVIYSAHPGIFFNFLMTILCKIFDVDLIVGIHLMNFFNEEIKSGNLGKRLLMRFYISFRTLTIRCQKNIRIQNRSDSNSLKKLGFRGNIFNIPPIIKSYDFTPNSSNFVNEFICLFVARLSVWHKGIDLLEEVVRRVLDKNDRIKFHIIGSGENGESIVDTMSKKYPRNVVWKGFLSESDLGHEYKEASLFLQTSRGENFGISLAEAQMSGLPAVAFRVMGAEDIILESYQGNLIEPFNTEEFSIAVLNYYESWKNNPAEYEEHKIRIASGAKDRYNSANIISQIRKMLRCD